VILGRIFSRHERHKPHSYSEWMGSRKELGIAGAREGNLVVGGGDFLG
jgi:hypothetical protein